MVPAGYLSVYRITESPPSHPVFVSNDPVGNKERSILALVVARLFEVNGHFHRVDGIITWVEGSSGIVTRFENLNLVFDEICNFDRKIEEVFFFFFGERHATPKYRDPTLDKRLNPCVSRALNFDIE